MKTASNHEPAVATYLRDLRATDARLPREEQYALARRAAAGDRKAGQRLVASVLPLAFRIALGYKSKRIPFADMVQQANLGACKALEGYDPERGVLFTTYAALWIRACCLEYLVRQHSLVSVGKTVAERTAFFASFKKDAADAGALDDEATAALALFRERLAPDTALDALTDHDAALADVRPSVEEEVASAEAAAERRRIIAAFVARLPARDREIFRRRFGEERATLGEVGETLGLSRERVRQIEARMLDELRAEMPRALAA